MAIPAMGPGRCCKFAMRDAKDTLLSIRYLYVWGRRDGDESRIWCCKVYGYWALTVGRLNKKGGCVVDRCVVVLVV